MHRDGGLRKNTLYSEKLVLLFLSNRRRKDTIDHMPFSKDQPKAPFLDRVIEIVSSNHLLER